MCPHCNSKDTVVGAGKGPHKASLHCSSCNRFIKWLSHKQKTKIVNKPKIGPKRFKKPKKFIADDIGVTTYIDALGRERMIGK